MDKRDWEVGDSYTVIDDGVRLKGKIVEITPDGYRVRWSDGRETVESNPDPAFQRVRGY